jgi:hypothetical protein
LIIDRLLRHDGPTFKGRRRADRSGHIPGLAQRAREDLFDHFGFRPRIGVHVRPIPFSQLPLHGLIQQAVLPASPEVVAESDVPFELDATRGENVNVNVQLRRSEHPVLVPVRFAYA